ncbi:MAG: hypothetical protein ACO1N4_10325 [Pedobacter sp.]
MKQLAVILVLFGVSLFTQAQTTVKKVKKVVQVMAPQTFYLNGRARGTLGGKSTATFNITLPKNTVEWFYSFTTSRAEKPKINIGLLSQLTRFYDPTGLSAMATNAVLTPSGAGVCDIYVMDRENCGKFNNRLDQLRGAFRYDADDSRENYRNGTVHIKDISSSEICLGFRNPSATEGTSITFEVAAIVEQDSVVQKSMREIEAETFARLGRSSFEREDYDRSLELNKRAVELDPELERAHHDIGMVHLIKNDYISAISSYATAITLFKKNAESAYWFNTAINDLKSLIARYGELEGANDILEMLKIEAPK